MRHGIVLSALVLAAIGLAALSIGTATAKDNAVAAGNLYFCDASQTGQVCETDITAGDTVTWSVVDGVHTVTQCTDETFATCSGGFDSDILQPAGTFTQAFASPGTYFYYCALHASQMRGKIVVAAATAAPTPTPSPAPTVSGDAGPAATAAPSLPSTGGAPGDGGVAAWLYGLIALGGMLLAGSGLSFALARERRA